MCATTQILCAVAAEMCSFLLHALLHIPRQWLDVRPGVGGLRLTTYDRGARFLSCNRNLVVLLLSSFAETAHSKRTLQMIYTLCGVRSCKHI